jgi:hypothetical protein
LKYKNKKGLGDGPSGRKLEHEAEQGKQGRAGLIPSTAKKKKSP